MTAVIFTLFGYLSGSVLYSELYARLFHKKSVTASGSDHNPGVFNAFEYGGFSCGLFTLIGDFFKAFIPVFLYIHYFGQDVFTLPLAAVMAAPVLGHAYSFFDGFRGGKGITASFGVLAALLPDWKPVAALAVIFIVFSVIIKVKTNYYRTLGVYLILGPSCLFLHQPTAVLCGMLLICVIVLSKLLLSREDRGDFEIWFFHHQIADIPDPEHDHIKAGQPHQGV